jgi:membrane-associated protease RseP (regulator of RpoE activity)
MDGTHSSAYDRQDKGFKSRIVHAVLLLFTCATTLVAGAIQQGINPLEEPGQIWRGIPFSFTLLFILGSHELGHFFMSRRYRVEVSLPYFIPAPSFIGTFGAFIKMKSPIPDRKALFDIGVAGPLSGLVAAIPVVITGLVLSDIVPVNTGEGIILGDSLLFSFLSWIVHGPIPKNLDIALHPVAFSGWIGLFVTNLNLLPVGQLDGGHVIYSLFGPKQKTIGRTVLIILVILGFASWTGWLVWAFLLILLGTRHPPVVYDWIPLDKKRRILGWFVLVIFILTFMPAPF